MDARRFQEAYQRLQRLDERSTYKLRPRSSAGMGRPSHEQLEERVRELAAYTLELKEILSELFLAIAGKPGGEPPASS